MIGFRLLLVYTTGNHGMHHFCIVLNRVSARTGAFKSHLAMFSMLAPGLIA